MHTIAEEIKSLVYDYVFILFKPNCSAEFYFPISNDSFCFVSGSTTLLVSHAFQNGSPFFKPRNNNKRTIDMIEKFENQTVFNRNLRTLGVISVAQLGGWYALLIVRRRRTIDRSFKQMISGLPHPHSLAAKCANHYVRRQQFKLSTNSSDRSCAVSCKICKQIFVCDSQTSGQAAKFRRNRSCPRC